MFSNHNRMATSSAGKLISRFWKSCKNARFIIYQKTFQKNEYKRVTIPDSKKEKATVIKAKQ